MPIIAIPFSLGGSVHPHFAIPFCRQGEFSGKSSCTEITSSNTSSTCVEGTVSSPCSQKIYIIKLPWILPGPDAKYVSRQKPRTEIGMSIVQYLFVSIGFRILFDLSLSVISSRVPKTYIAIGLYLLVLLHLYCSTLFSSLQLTNCKN